ncbi:hypothetical protein FJD06_25930 [Escherichia coli]|nr:hypothetical protein [Escherichia coli]
MLVLVATALSGGIAILTLVFYTLHRVRDLVVAQMNQMLTDGQGIEQEQFDSPPLDTSLPNELRLLANTFN